jgi:hypothetical protein
VDGEGGKMKRIVRSGRRVAERKCVTERRENIAKG